MKLNKEDLLLYGVTDSKYLKGRKMSELVEEAILGGVTMIQLREKEMTHEAFKQEALDVQSVCQKHHVPLIINDDVELCKEIDADGVHIGQDDLNLKEARKKFIDFTKNLWIQEVTENGVGSNINFKLNKVFELDRLYYEIKTKYDILYKNLNIEKYTKSTIVIAGVLVALLIFNILNYINMIK